MHMIRPIIMSHSVSWYTVIPSLLFAGKHPIILQNEGNDNRCLDFPPKIKRWISLIETYPESAMHLAEYKTESVELIHIPIADFSIPTKEQMDQALAFIDDSMQTFKPLYISCAQGLGRTGTIIACFLAKQFCISGDSAMNVLTQLRKDAAFQVDSYSPETEEQCNFVISMFPGISS